MSKLEQHSDFTWYPSEGIRHEFRRTIYCDGVVIYNFITETDNFYDALEVTEGQYYDGLSNARAHQRKMNARRSDEQNG